MCFEDGMSGVQSAQPRPHLASATGFTCWPLAQLEPFAASVEASPDLKKHYPPPCCWLPVGGGGQYRIGVKNRAWERKWVYIHI